MGLLGWLGVLFIGLKLTHCIDWSWWWVTAPLYALPVILVIGTIFIGSISEDI